MRFAKGVQLLRGLQVPRLPKIDTHDLSLDGLFCSKKSNDYSMTKIKRDIYFNLSLAYKSVLELLKIKIVLVYSYLKAFVLETE